MKKIIRNFSKIIYNNSPVSTFIFLLFIFVSTFLIFFIISILHGYEVNVLEKLIVNSYDIEITNKNGSYFRQDDNSVKYLESLKKKSGIKNFDLFNISQALVKSRGYFTGVNILSFFELENISSKVNSDIKPQKGYVYVGTGLKKDFGLKKGDRLEISNLEEKMIFSVGGFFETGISDMDNLYVIMERTDFSDFYIIPESYEKIGIYLNKRSEMDKIKNKLSERFEDIEIIDIYTKNSTFISAINMEKLISLIVSGIIFFLFFLSAGIFIIARLNNFRKEFAFMMITGIKLENMALSVWIVFSGVYSVCLLVSVIASVFILDLLNGIIPIPKEVYFIDRLYLLPDYFFMNVFLILNLLFTFFVYIIFLNFFKSIKVDQELRGS